METSFSINNLDQASALFKPIRLEILGQLAQPRTCSELAEVFGTSPQKVYYHIKVLQEAGLVNKVKEERVRGIMEGYYQAAARSYWLSPEMVGKLGGAQQARQNISLGNLLGLAEQLHSEVASLAPTEDEVPTVGLSAQIELRRGEDRQAFLEELQQAVQNLAEKYGNAQEGTGGETFRLMLACYPRPIQKNE
jgi:DNA-binding transcriptional ArsR family regulator